MSSRDYEDELKRRFPAGAVVSSEPRYFWIDVDRAMLRDAIRILRDELGISHLTTIVGEDMRDYFLASYVLAGEVVVVLKVKADRDKPEIPSLAASIPGAIVYEREIHDLLGIVFLEHPGLIRQVLPEDWPEGLYPLRKDATLPRPIFDEEDGGRDA
jgi:Ni,Fe-hydrogenase III component G